MFANGKKPSPDEQALLDPIFYYRPTDTFWDHARDVGIAAAIGGGAYLLAGILAAPTIAFGSSDLALGLSSGGALTKFIDRFGGLAKTFGQFVSTARTFPGQIKDAMTQAARIRFNLDGVNVSRLSGKLNEYGEPAAGYTNYELWLIKNTAEFLSKTKFYQNGKEVASPF